MKEMEKNQNRNQSNKENKGKMSGPLLLVSSYLVLNECVEQCL
jgi:hypothetical protein